MMASQIPKFTAICMDEIYEICRFAIEKNLASLLELAIDLFPTILIYQKSHDESIKEESYYPIFHLACKQGNTELVSMLLKKGANPNHTVQTVKYFSSCKRELTRMEGSEKPYDVINDPNIRQILKANRANTNPCEYSYSTIELRLNSSL